MPIRIKIRFIQDKNNKTKIRCSYMERKSRNTYEIITKKNLKLKTKI